MDSELIQQINDQLKEMNELMGRQTAAMSSQLKSIKAATDSANNQRTSNNNLNSAQNDAGNKSIAQTKLSEMSRLANEKTEAATNQLSKSFAEGKNALFGLAGALLDTTPGLSKYSNSVESATNAVAGVTSIFGPLGAVAGLLLKGFSSLVGAAFKYSDSLVDAYDKFASAGAGIGSSAEGIIKLGHAAGLSSGTLPYLTKNIEALGSDLRALGTTSSGGAEKFARIIAVGDKQLQGYRKLGFTQEELIESQKTYLQLQAQAGADLKRSPQELQKASLKYIDELNAFAEVTGISKKRQEDALAQALAQENFNAYMNKLESDKKEALARGDKAEAERIDGVIQAKQNLAKYAQANFSAAKAQAVLEGISTDGNTIMTENTAKLKMSGINIEKINANANKGMDQTGELAGQSAQSAENFRKNFGDLGTAAGKESRNLQDTFFQDNGTRMAAARDADLKGEDRQKIFNQRMDNARKAAEIAKNRENGVMAQKAAIEAQERAARVAFDGLLSQLSAQMTGLLMKVLPYVTKAIQFVSNHFDEITKAAKILAVFFAGLGAVAVAGKVVGSIRSLGGKVAGLFGKKSGSPGSKNNPMYVSYSGAGAGMLGGGGGDAGGAGDGGGGSTTGALQSAAKQAPQVLLGAATLGAAMVEIGAGLAAATWMMGGAIGKFAKGLKEFNKLDGRNLAQAGLGMAGLGVGIAAMGAGAIAEAMGTIIKYFTGDKDPLQQSVEMLTELQKANIDRNRVEDNGAALVAYAKAMAAVAGLGAARGLGDAIKGLYDGVSSLMEGKSALDEFVEFSKLDINLKKTKNNSLAFTYFSDAMASFKGFESPMGAIGTALADATVKFFDVKPPLEQFVFFSHLNINKKKTKNNAIAFKQFSEAMASYKGGQGLLSAVSTIAAAKLNEIFGQDSATDSFYKFSKMDFGKNAESNARSFLNFSKAMNILSGGSSSVVDTLATAGAAAGAAVVGAIGGAAAAVGKFFTGDAGTQQGQEVKIGNEVRKGGTVSWRTNNPGNVSYGGLAKQHGAVGRWIKPDGDKQQRTTGIAIMPTYDHGLKLKMALWRRPMYQPLTIDQGVSQWTLGTPTANLGTAYAKDMAKAAGVPVNTPLKSLSDSQLRAAVIKQEKWEGFKAGTVSQARKGGLFKGPTGGYPIELHGTELVIPVTPNSILTKLMEDTPDAEKMSDAILKAVSGTIDNNPANQELDDLLEQDNIMKTMLVDKFNKMLDILDNKQTTSGKLLKRKLAS